MEMILNLAKKGCPEKVERKIGSGHQLAKVAFFGCVLIWRGAWIVLNLQRLALPDALRVGTTRAPVVGWNFKSGHDPNFTL